MTVLARLAARLARRPFGSPDRRGRRRPSAADPLADPDLARMTAHQLSDLPFEALRRRARQDNDAAASGPRDRREAC